jgi:hypothetical protein
MNRALVISYSHTGQTEMAVSTFARGFSENIACDFAIITPLEKFEFPWKMRNFFRAFPRCVAGLAPEVQSLDIAWQNYDLVILAYQVWFLSPSLPIQGFLNSSQAQNLKNKKIITLVTCRNLWHSAFYTIRKALRNLGAEHLGQVTLCETSPVWATFVTTPRWLLTGKKGPFLFFPAAGISPMDFVQLEQKGRRLSQSWQDSSGSAVSASALGSNLSSVALAQMDQIGIQLFRFWTRLILKLSNAPGVWQDFLLLVFRMNLILVILVATPGATIFEILVGNDPKLRRET